VPAAVTKPAAVGATDDAADTIPSAVDYLRRGDRLLTVGDVTSARLFYEAALTAGESEAITAIGKTFDPVSLNQIGLAAYHANPIKAAEWYLQAAKAGDPEAYKHRDEMQQWLTQSNSLSGTQKRTLRRLLNEPVFSSRPVAKSASID
jgi:TPR repeat protein